MEGDGRWLKRRKEGREKIGRWVGGERGREEVEIDSTCIN